MAVLIGLLVAASYGSGDFLGGLASRQAGTLRVLLFAQITAFLGAVVIAFSVGDSVTVDAIALGIGAGLLNVTGLGCLYQGLAVGQIGQVAPVASVIGAILPVSWGLATGERPSSLALAGAGSQSSPLRSSVWSEANRQGRGRERLVPSRLVPESDSGLLSSCSPTRRSIPASGRC